MCCLFSISDPKSFISFIAHFFYTWLPLAVTVLFQLICTGALFFNAGLSDLFYSNGIQTIAVLFVKPGPFQQQFVCDILSRISDIPNIIKSYGIPPIKDPLPVNFRVCDGNLLK